MLSRGEMYHLLRAAHFQAMPAHALFINTARGDCLDEQALIAELQRGRLFAFLDVTDPEPAAVDSPLRQLENVVLTSHIAGPPSYRIGRQVVEDIQSYLNGGEPRSVIQAGMLPLIA